jgi:hypothetical protein
MLLTQWTGCAPGIGQGCPFLFKCTYVLRAGFLSSCVRLKKTRLTKHTVGDGSADDRETDIHPSSLPASQPELTLASLLSADHRLGWRRAWARLVCRAVPPHWRPPYFPSSGLQP